MNISQHPGSQADGPPDPDGLMSPDFQDQPIPDYEQQKRKERESLYRQGVPKIPEMSVSQWLLVHLLLWIPIVGLVMRIIWATGTVDPGKENLVNFSRASLIWMAIEIGISIFLTLAVWNSLYWLIMNGFHAAGYPV